MAADLDSSELRHHLVFGTPWMDVRAPVEFAKGHLPGAVNLPLLNDIERAKVGLAYKQGGQQAAIDLGHQLVSAEVKDARIRAWVDFINQNPQANIYCFRGGLRSHITQSWLKEQNVDRPVLTGGYKRGRNFLLNEATRLYPTVPAVRIAGLTGSGKTLLIQSLKSKGVATIDLETLANHRGSAFGARENGQPTQAQFENTLAVQLMRNEFEKRVWFEDESRLIGRLQVPAGLFARLQASPVIWVEESLESRVERTFQEYILQSDLTMSNDIEVGQRVFDRFRASLLAISRRLGGARFTEVHTLLLQSEQDFRANRGLESNRDWIRFVLVEYYDPLYLLSFKQSGTKVLYRGLASECESMIFGRGDFSDC